MLISVANLAENPLDLADFASVWQKIFAFGGQRISAAGFFSKSRIFKKDLTMKY